MKVYQSELDNWSKARAQIKAEALTSEQLNSIDFKSRQLLKQTLDHQYLHNLAGLILISALIALDLYVFTLKGVHGMVILTLVHGFILYGLTNYTMHEGAGHKRIILGQNKVLKILAFIVHNLSRIFFADPYYYQQSHPSHHQHLGLPQDQAFTQMVEPKRILKSFLPGAAIFEFNDYKIHSGDAWTKSKTATLILGLAYSFILWKLAVKNHHPALMIFIILVGTPWVSFTLDRLRESSEHMLMKSDDLPEARELGNNFWGYLIGGGPWGQPCHLSHHISPALPWYQQLRLSAHLKKVMTPAQREHFFVSSFPKKFSKLMKKNAAFFRKSV